MVTNLLQKYLSYKLKDMVSSFLHIFLSLSTTPDSFSRLAANFRQTILTTSPPPPFLYQHIYLSLDSCGLFPLSAPPDSLSPTITYSLFPTLSDSLLPTLPDKPTTPHSPYPPDIIFPD